MDLDRVVDYPYGASGGFSMGGYGGVGFVPHQGVLGMALGLHDNRADYHGIMGPDTNGKWNRGSKVVICNFQQQHIANETKAMVGIEKQDWDIDHQPMMPISCEKLVVAKKQLAILKAPNVLVIQLKWKEFWFYKDLKEYMVGRLIKRIAFKRVYFFLITCAKKASNGQWAISILSLECMHKKREKRRWDCDVRYALLQSLHGKEVKDPCPQYNLYGTIVHSGYSPDSGHYYAYIKDAMGRWYCCNDSFVSISNLQEVVSEKVYILFFSRSNQRPQPTKSPSVTTGVEPPHCNDHDASSSVTNGVKPPSCNGHDASSSVTNGVKPPHCNGHDRHPLLPMACQASVLQRPCCVILCSQ
ncbi:hypothetical protein IFM89_013977 [Coptis chinensis]|uniref:ubiquitinyl hydrolase 1 n=1 Tax=Coptis chinensis TaxID=261450 RepID=A0A835M8U0_9MAGN|nr:hypothetical protein IFM89_013977 [Coptis chinensis]